jgi:hypothetical protein
MFAACVYQIGVLLAAPAPMFRFTLRRLVGYR